MLGTFVLNLQEISGFSRICPGDEYELMIRYGQQKWKTRGRILKQNKNQQIWTRDQFDLKAKLADLLLIKISEVKLLGVSLKTIGTKCFEVNNFYSIDPQRMIINADQSGTIKLIFIVTWNLYDQVDTKFTFYNPNRTYSDVTRTWSMFVGNTTLIRTVNDTLSSSSQSSSKRLSTFYPTNSEEYLPYTPVTDESNHYDEIDLEEKDSSSFANSDEICSAEEETESIYALELIVEQIRTSLDDLRLIDRVDSKEFDRIEQTIQQLDRTIQIQIHEETEKTLEIENILGDFHFLNAIDDEDTSKTIDSGFEGEQQNSSHKSNPNQLINHLLFDVLNRILILLHVNSKPISSLIQFVVLVHSELFQS